MRSMPGVRNFCYALTGFNISPILKLPTYAYSICKSETRSEPAKRHRVNIIFPMTNTLRAQITKRVYPHLLRHSVPTTLLERGMPIEQCQTFLGHSKHETTQRYAVSSTAMMRESSQRALAR